MKLVSDVAHFARFSSTSMSPTFKRNSLKRDPDSIRSPMARYRRGRCAWATRIAAALRDGSFIGAGGSHFPDWEIPLGTYLHGR